MTSNHKGENWPYHEDKHGSMVPCASNPCKLHGGSDVIATSPEEAYELRNAEAPVGLESEPIQSYATPNRTYDSKKSFLDKIEGFHQQAESLEWNRTSSNAGVWLDTFERSETYSLGENTEENWAKAQREAAEMASSWQQDAILVTRPNPNGNSTRMTFKNVSMEAVQQAMKFLAKQHESDDGWFGAGGTYQNGNFIVIDKDDSMSGTDKSTLIKTLKQHDEEKIDAEFIEGKPEEDRLVEDRLRESSLRERGLISPQSKDKNTDPELSNDIDNLKDWVFDKSSKK